MNNDPIQTATNGRTTAGRFGLGNQFAKGHSSRAQRLRAAMLSAITEDDVAAVVLSLLNLAIDGNVPAAKLIFDIVGKPEHETPDTAPEINETNFQEIKNAWLAKLN